METTIVKALELNVPVSRVWRALTDYVEFGKWFYVKLDGPFVPGEIARGHITYPGYEYVKWESTITAMEAERLFAYSWHPCAVEPGVDYSKETPTLVEFRLEAISSGTRLTVTESGFENIPSYRRSDAYWMNDFGWSELMDNFKKYLSTQMEAATSS